MYKEKDLLISIKESFANYQQYGARSTKKLLPLHKYFANVLHSIWGNNYEIHFMSESTKEATVEGKYYPKDIDIAVIKDTKAVLCLGIKFITSNYKQNANNYFENMMGETANIQANRIPYLHFIVMRYKTPYYEKNQTIPKKLETINKKDIQKYLNLIYDTSQAHKPKELCIFLVDIDDKSGKVSKTKIENELGKDFSDLMIDKLSPENFFNKIEYYKKYLELPKDN